MNPPTMHYCIDTIGSYDGLFTGENCLVSAGLAWNNPGDGFTLHVPDAESLIVDSGGFQATTRWGLDYPYSAKDYFDWAESIGADYVACMDYACEPDLHDSSVHTRVHKTIEDHAYCTAHYYDNDYSFSLLPVLQGYEPEEYRECCQAFKDHGIASDYMAIGTVCKRDNPRMIERVLDVCCEEFPEASWHLFGATLRVYKDRRLWGRVRSTDTAAWNWGADSKAHKKELYREYKHKVEQYQNAISTQQVL